MRLDDPFDLDDHRPRRATEVDNFIAAGVREVEVKREARSETCPECFGDGGAGHCFLCAGWGTVSASTLSRAWEAASGEGQVVS